MRFLVAATVAAVGLVLAGGASAGSSYNLHPAGFGPHSYAAWKAQQGTTDDNGGASQALYLQKMTATTTYAAGVAVVTGLEGLHANELTGLSWWHREDGHCGAGAPRWNIGVEDGNGTHYSVFLGCNAAQHAEEGTFSGHGWCEDTQPSPPSAIAAATGKNPADLTITGLAIVFDEGSDTPNPPPAGCIQEAAVPGGFVYLDNIDVQINGQDHCWTNAGDNGSTSSTTCGPAAGTSTSGSSPSLGVPTAVAVDPTDTALVNGLNLAAPSVPLLSWSLYPDVVY